MHLVDVLKRACRPLVDTSTMRYKVTQPHMMTWHSANTWTWDGHLVRFAVFTKKQQPRVDLSKYDRDIVVYFATGAYLL